MQVFGIPDYWPFLVGSVLIVLLPGPNSMLVLATAARHGVATGYRAAAGTMLGDLVLMSLSVGGAASLLRSHPSAFSVVKYLGAGYLVWLGFGMVRAGVRMLRARSLPPVPADVEAPVAAEARDVAEARGVTEARDVTNEPPGPVKRSRRGPFLTALVVCLLNPKSILFFVAFFVQFLSPSDPHPLRSFAVLAVTMQAISFLYLTSLIFGGSYLAERFRRHRRVSGTGTASVGLAFMAFGAKLATVTLR